MARTAHDPIARLAEYWFRAKMMHDFVHAMMADHNGSIDSIYDAQEGWEFEMFLDHWLSGLFVVVEGFNKLKLKDARVQRLFQAHIQYLKAMRHETYHFVVDRKAADAIFSQLNWAEDLHKAIGDFIRERIGEGAKEEARQARIAKKRALANRR
jgi:hypothetical protein